MSEKTPCVIDYGGGKGLTTIQGRAQEVPHCIVEALNHLGESSIGAVITEIPGGHNQVRIYSDSVSKHKTVTWGYKELPGRPAENQVDIADELNKLKYDGQRGHLAHGAKIVASVGPKHNHTMIFFIHKRT